MCFGKVIMLLCSICRKMRVLVGRVESYRKVGEFVERVFENFSFKAEYLKPNFLKHDGAERGCITHPDVIKAVLKRAREDGVDLAVIEGGFYRKSAEKCFDKFGLKKYAECINLNSDRFTNIKVGGRALRSVKVAETAIRAAEVGYISVPKMKVHHLTTVTVGIKNNMGFLKKPAIYMHRNIHQKLVDLLKIFKPSLVIVDGVIGGEQSEMRSRPVRHGVMVASDNVVAADYVAAKLMGFNPMEIEHIRLAMEAVGLAEGDIEILSDCKVEELIKPYSLSISSRVLGRLGI